MKSFLDSLKKQSTDDPLHALVGVGVAALSLFAAAGLAGSIIGALICGCPQ